MRINNDALVKLHYKLYCGNGTDDEDFVEETTEETPLEFIFGAGLMLPAFEAELVGKSDGDEFDFVLDPQNAYGPRQDDLNITLDKEVFFVDGAFDDEMVAEDEYLPMLTADGQQVLGRVVKVNENTVEMDFNHDLAGETLHFIGHIVEVSQPTEEDYKRLLPHHHDCGCDHKHDGCDCKGHKHSKGGCGHHHN